MGGYDSFEDITDRMLARVDDSYDKRESSPIYAAIAPAAMEVMQLQAQLTDMMDEFFADTASREYLVRIAATRGIHPREATKALVRGVFTPPGLELAEGARFTSPGTSYVLAAREPDGSYRLECEDAGETGNLYTGTIVPAEYIDGLETASVTEVLVYGEPEEGTGQLRQRYLDTFTANEFGGNRMDYHNKTLAIPGVGAVKILRAGGGAGTVGLVVLDSAHKRASGQLVGAVQEVFDPHMDGMGDGLAPIGHVVTVGTVEDVAVNIQCRAVFDGGYDYNTCQAAILDIVGAYFSGVREAWAGQEKSIVRISSINSAIMSVQGVLDVSGTRLNGVPENLEIGECQVPVLGEVGVVDG